MDLGLKGNRAIVLAASRGLGYASAFALAKEGCEVVICGRNRDGIELAAAQIQKETKTRVVGIEADVANQDQVKQLVNQTISDLGGVEILVHNAGGPKSGSFSELESEQWSDSFHQNLMSFVWLLQAALPSMKAARYGRILAIASSSVRQPIPNLLLSNTIRPGVYGLAKSLSKELGSYNILVNVILPGRILTERTIELDEAEAKRKGITLEEVRRISVATIPLGRLGEPNEVANLVVFLSSKAASYISGNAIHVDGGKIDAL